MSLHRTGLFLVCLCQRKDRIQVSTEENGILSFLRTVHPVNRSSCHMLQLPDERLLSDI